MNCFYHQEKSAIGLCKCCSKGLCADCATDLEFGLACKGKHEEQVQSVNMIIEKNAKIYSAAPRNILIAPLFSFFMGILFLVFGYQSKGGANNLIFFMGVGFVVYAFVVFFRNRALFSGSKNA